MQNLIISLLRTSQTKYLQLLAPNDLLATPKKVPDKEVKKKKKSDACEKYHNYHQLKQDISGEIKQREKGIKLASAEYRKIVIYAIKAMPPGISKNTTPMIHHPILSVTLKGIKECSYNLRSCEQPEAGISIKGNASMVEDARWLSSTMLSFWQNVCSRD